MAYWPMNGNFTDAGPNAIVTTNNGATATIQYQRQCKWRYVIYQPNH
jgi:hypothetical protein